MSLEEINFFLAKNYIIFIIIACIQLLILIIYIIDMKRNSIKVPISMKTIKYDPINYGGELEEMEKKISAETSLNQQYMYSQNISNQVNQNKEEEVETLTMEPESNEINIMPTPEPTIMQSNVPQNLESLVQKDIKEDSTFEK